MLSISVSTPTTQLPLTQIHIFDLPLKLQAEHDLAYLFISHDLKIVRALSDQLIVLRNGVVVEQGEADHVFESPSDPYTRALISAAFDFELEDESVLEQ